MSIYFIYEQPEFNTKDFVTYDDSQDAIKEFKIGESINPIERCKTLQTGNKRRLIIYKTVFCGTKPAAQTLESTIHERFKERRLHGEWYTISRQEVDMLILEIEQLREAEFAVARQRYLEQQSLSIPEFK